MVELQSQYPVFNICKSQFYVISSILHTRLRSIPPSLRPGGIPVQSRGHLPCRSSQEGPYGKWCRNRIAVSIPGFQHL